MRDRGLGVRAKWGHFAIGVCVVGAFLAAFLYSIGGQESGPAPDTVIRRLGRGVARVLSSAFPPKAGKPGQSVEPIPSRSRARSSQEAESESSFQIYGRVVNESRQPVSEARIYLRESGSSDFLLDATTNANGDFELIDVAPRSYDVLVSHPDYVPIIRLGYSPPPNRKRERMDFQLPLGIGITGVVRDEEGTPVANALVSARRRHLEQLSPGGDVYLDDSVYKTAATDNDGTFTLRGIAYGENLFEIRAPGFDVLVEERKLDALNAKERLQFTLRRSGRIAGVVLDENDKPVTSASVKLLTYKPIGGTALKLSESEKHTRLSNAQGEFVFDKLSSEGFYDLAVEHPEFAPAYFPLIAPGTVRQVCRLSRGGSIKGSAVYIDRVTTPAAVNILAEAIINETTFTRTTASDGTGAFTFSRLPFAAYRLQVTNPQLANEPLTGVRCERAKPEVSVLLEVFEKCTAQGRVIDAETEAPVDGAEVKVECSYGPRQARRRNYAASSGPLGAFKFDSLPSGIIRIQATAPGYVASASSGCAQTFTLLPGETKTDLTLRLSRGGTVDGFVYDFAGRSVEGADVQLFVSATSLRSLDTSALKAKTDASGYFRISGIDVGNHLQLYASAERSGYARGRSALLDLTSSKPYVSTQIVLSRGATVRGFVLDERKLPIPDAQVEFTSEEFPNDPSYRSQKTQTKADGSYSFSQCPAGRAHMRVSKAGYVDGHRSLRLEDGEVRDNVDFQLRPGLIITGRLLTLEGKPIANARVRAVPHKYVPGRDETITDKAGNFTLRNLGNGLFDVRANFPLQTPDGEQRYEFFKLGVKSGTLGIEIGCDVNNSVVGTVEGEDKKPVDRFHLSLRSRRDTSPVQEFYFDLERHFANARGFFRILNVPRGIYTLTITADGYEVYRKDDVVIGPSRRTVLPRIRLKMAGGIIGYVYSSETDRPINDVTVRLTTPEKTEDEARRTALVARTDYAGFFRIATAGGGTYALELEHPQYIFSRLYPVNVRPRGTTDVGRIYLEAGGSIQGVVIDEEGYGVNWARVKVSGVNPEKQTRTNSLGNYLLMGVRPGRWPLVVDANVGGRRVYVYRLVDVVAGETREENFMLETSANLIGTLTCDVGAVRSGNLHLQPFNEFSTVIEDIRYDATLRNQQFSISRVPPGQYFLWASGYGPISTYTIWETVYLQRGDNSVGLKLPTASVTAVAQHPSQGPVSGINVQLMPIFDSFGVPRSVYNSLARRGVTNSAGQVYFGHVMPGAHQVLYFDPNVVGGGQWLALPYFWVAPGQNVSGLILPLNP